MHRLKGECPGCRRPYSIRPEIVGKRLQCKRCGRTFLYSTPDDSASSGSSTSRCFAADEEVPAEWQPGDDILGQYQVISILGQGGMGTVYRVRHIGWNQELAVKCIGQSFLAERRSALAEFEREAETWVGLPLHPNIVSCWYVRRLGGFPRLFAELVEGGSLKQWIDEGTLYHGEPREALRTILDVAIQFAWGLHAAHEQGLVHQDIKPANVMMTAEGMPKVTDFGLTKARSAIAENALGHEPRAGILVSFGGMTPAYCSPEQAARKGLSHATDLWSWAASVLEMFSGGVAWASGTAAGGFLEDLVEAGPDDSRIPCLPAALAVLLRRCFAVDPMARPSDMLEAAEALKQAYSEAVGEEYGRERPDLDKGLADTLNNRAVSHFDLGKRAAAARLWAEALQFDPQHPESVYNLGLLRWRDGRTTGEDLAARLNALSADPLNLRRVQRLLCQVHLEHGNAEAALVALEPLAQQAKDDRELRALLNAARSGAARWKRCIKTFVGHSSGVLTAAFSPNGKLAASGGQDKSIRIWRTSTGKSTHVLESHDNWVHSLVFTPDGRHLLSASKDLRLWDVLTGRLLQVFGDSSPALGEFFSVAASPCGRYALTGGSGDNEKIRLWNLSTGLLTNEFEGHLQEVHSVTFSPDGRNAVTGGGYSSYDVEELDSALRYWDIRTGELVREFEGHREPVKSIAFSPTGQFVLSGGSDGVRLWDVNTGRLKYHLGKECVDPVAFAPSGVVAACGEGRGARKTIRVFEVNSGRLLHVLPGHLGEGLSALAYSPDAQLLLSASGGTFMKGEPILRLWEANAGAAQPLSISRPETGADVLSRACIVANLSHRAQRAIEEAAYRDAYDLATEAMQVPGYSRASTLLRIRAHAGRFGRATGLRYAWLARSMHEHDGAVSSVGFSNDGTQLLAGGVYEKLCLFETSTGKLARVLKGHDFHQRISLRNEAEPFPGRDVIRIENSMWDQVTIPCLTFSPDGRTAFTGGFDETVRHWNLSDGMLLRTHDCYYSTVYCVAFSPTGREILSGGAHSSIRRWETATGRLLNAFDGCTGGVVSLAYSPDGRFAASGHFDDAPIRLYWVQTGRVVRTLEGHCGRVRSLAFSPDGRLLASGGKDGTIRLWAVDSGKCLRTFSPHAATVQGNTAAPALAQSAEVSTLAFLPDGLRLLSGGWDHQIRLWDVQAARLTRTFRGHSDKIQVVAVTPDGRRAVSGGWDNSAIVWDVESGQSLRVYKEHSDEITTLAVSPNGTHVVSGGGDKKPRLWDIQSGKTIRHLPEQGGHVSTLAFSPDARLLACGAHAAQSLALWRTETGERHRVLEGLMGPVWSIAVSSNGSRLLSGSGDGIVRLWDAVSGQQLSNFDSGCDRVTELAATRDGQFAVSAGAENEVRIWEIESGRLARILAGHTGKVIALAISHDDRLVLSAGEDKNIRLWELSTGRHLLTCRGHAEEVLSVGISPDGQYAVSGSADKTVRIWDLETGNLLRTLEGHEGAVNAVAFSPDGRFVATAGEDKSVRLWELIWDCEFA